MRTPAKFLLFSLLLILLSIDTAGAELSQSEARKLIANIAGVSISKSEIRVLQVTQESASSASVLAQIELAFRATLTKDGIWQLTEIRLGPEHWEDIAVIARAGNFQLPAPNCTTKAQKSKALNNAGARCLIADLFGISLPSDSVRITELSSFGLPLGTRASALIVSLVDLNFRFSKDKGRWDLDSFRSGSRDWVDVRSLPQAVNSVKQSIARDELASIAKALDAYRRDRGSFVVSEKEAVVIDHLCPRYLSQVFRLDPWHHPYQYRGERDRFTLRSVGPDGKPDTSDDVVTSSANP